MTDQAHAPFTDPRLHNEVKAAFHGALLAVAAPILIFNLHAYRDRRETHHLVNIVSLLWMIGLEGLNFKRHLK